MHDLQGRAAQAQLTYIQDFSDGFTRKKCGKGFTFIDLTGKAIKDKKIRDRIVGLVIPPAWREVWICMDEDGHIQATGFDDAGRKQYIYHPRWHEASSLHKYGRLKEFGRLLPSIRRKVQGDLVGDDLTKRRVVAAVVRLLDKACIRIGNKQYLEANDSRGATTLTADNVVCNKHDITLDFKGKSGKQVQLQCHDEGLAAVIEDCEKSDGEFLFSYPNQAGDIVPVTSADVNAYLIEISKNPVTAKDFRTWRGSLVAFKHLCAMAEGLSKTAKKRYITEGVKLAAATLNNTPAVCRRSYIHSALLAAAESETLTQIMRDLDSSLKPTRRRTGLKQDEIRLMAFLAYLEETGELPAAVALADAA